MRALRTRSHAPHENAVFDALRRPIPIRPRRLGTRRHQVQNEFPVFSHTGDVAFAATGVTDGSMLEGVHRHGQFVTTSSILMRSGTRTVRWVKARHIRGHAP